MNEVIRLDFILSNVFSYLIEKRYKLSAISSINAKEKDILEKIKEIIKTFRDNHTEYMRKTACYAINVKIFRRESSVNSILLDIKNELFSENINWSLIIAFFVFVGELTLMCLSKNFPESIVYVIYDSFSTIVKDYLYSWIEHHGNWPSLVASFHIDDSAQWKKNLFLKWAKIFFYNLSTKYDSFI